MTVTDPIDLRPTRSPRAAAVSKVLASAFVDDPVFTWLVPDRAERAEILEPVFDAYGQAFARHDETHLRTMLGFRAGAAMWSPPGVAPIDPADEDALVERIVALAGDNMGRFEECLERFEAVHPSEPAWYLQFLGVVPALHGRGLGSDLLRQVLDRADAAGEAAYLEATSPRNRALYERHGFRVTAEVELPDGPTAYAMWRDPR